MGRGHLLSGRLWLEYIYSPLQRSQGRPSITSGSPKGQSFWHFGLGHFLGCGIRGVKPHPQWRQCRVSDIAMRLYYSM